MEDNELESTTHRKMDDKLTFSTAKVKLKVSTLYIGEGLSADCHITKEQRCNSALTRKWRTPSYQPEGN